MKQVIPNGFLKPKPTAFYSGQQKPIKSFAIHLHQTGTCIDPQKTA
jgi:hypothetical protein